MQAYIVDFIRTPIGRYGGVLSTVRTDDLAALPVRTLVGRHKGIDAAAIDEVILGCANQAGEDNRNVARMASLLAGLPETVPGMTVNRLCASGLDAVIAASRQIKTGEADLDAAWWELVARHQLLTPPEARAAPDWAAKIHIAVAPVYYHTYLYGSIVALQLRDALRAEAGGLVDRPPAGEILAGRLFAAGQSVRWDRLVEQATGAPLTVDSLAREVATV